MTKGTTVARKATLVTAAKHCPPFFRAQGESACFRCLLPLQRTAQLARDTRNKRVSYKASTDTKPSSQNLLLREKVT